MRTSVCRIGNLMAAKRPTVMKKRSEGRSKTSLRPAAAPEVIVNPAKIGSGSESPAVFDPRLLLTKINGGKTRHQYRANKSIFAQGDEADAVFYIEKGKVKLTVVSSLGKEAVVAILPETSFFGEGCLAGQSVRIATASTVEPSTIIRMEKRLVLSQLRQEQDFAGHFSLMYFPEILEWKQTSWITFSTLAKSGLPGFSFCWLILGKNPSRFRSLQK